MVNKVQNEERLDGLAKLLAELIERYADQIDLEKIETEEIREMKEIEI